jgi:AcrR family transcriptional regulator
MLQYGVGVARQRLHSLDDLLDVAEQLVTIGDPAGLTLRSLATSSGASNGTIYHAFRSKEELLARLWLRATARLGAGMEEAMRSIGQPAHGGSAGQETVVAVAVAPVVFTRRHPVSAQLFFAQRSDQLFSADLAPAIVSSLEEEKKRFTALLIQLAAGVWERTDRFAVEAIAACVVDIPGGMLRRALIEGRPADEATERRIEAAVRAILALPLDPPPRKTRSPR